MLTDQVGLKGGELGSGQEVGAQTPPVPQRGGPGLCSSGWKGRGAAVGVGCGRSLTLGVGAESLGQRGQGSHSGRAGEWGLRCRRGLRSLVCL